jgi:O-antigen/teichoic acid export membrane protein
MIGLLQRFTTNQRLVVGQTIVQVLGKAITVLGSFLVVRMISSRQGLGVSGFGNFSLVTVYVAYFYLLLDFGFNTVFVQWATREPDKRLEYFSQLLSLRVCLSVAMIVAGLVILPFLPSDTYTPLIKLGVIACLSTIALQGLFMTGNAFFQLHVKYQLSVVVAVLAALVNLSATYIALRLGFGLTGILLAFIAEYIVLGVGSLILVRRYLPWYWVINWQKWRQLILESLPLGLSILLTIVYFRSDMFMLGVLPLNPALGLVNKQAIGLYNLPYSIFEVFLTLPAFIMNATYPLMLQAYAQSAASLRGLMTKTLLASVAISVVIVLGTWLFAPLVINLQTHNNPDFHPSVLLLRILSLGLPAFFMTNVLVFTLICLGRKKWLPMVYVVAGIVNIAANLWLIPQFGPVAAAATTIGTELLILIILAYLTWTAFGQTEQMSLNDEVVIAS